ncbi:hypothetical protein DACRYDRAFT_112948 [Dacryopinax primogenitus]|uniref:non-specific serine/threonine protein kinase n=1 Tax=Dacryopinax primogenitus (strain DJM 731) TaxID=1858805 RepID=M5GCH0_DACPD|nr:uncharacterized protein DACRYDRAFT_112948 [Dacryopinax primogenitus]EJU06200.1 hypothetical protein DACRYDRAFT_112948 [Dacryopinax primogenitus]
MARPNSLQMFASSPPTLPFTSVPSSTATSPSPNAPTPASTPAPPTGTSPSASQISVASHPSYIQRHFRRRLQASKQACDTELKKVIHAVTAYVEHSLRAQQEAEWEEEEEARLHERDDLLAVESTSDDAGDESDAGGGVRRKKKVSNTHRHRRSFMLSSGTKLPPMGASTALAIPGTSATHPIQAAPQAGGPSTSPVRMSASSSPTSTWNRTSNIVVRRASRSRRYTLSPPLPATVPGNVPPPLALQPAPLPGATVPLPPSLAPSRASSRSRSRSPLPAATARARSPIGSPTSELPQSDSSPAAKLDFISTLRDLVSLSTTLVEMPLSTLTSPSSPHALSEIVQNVQALGKAWDLRPDWHGRGWYVQVLLAVASLSRVVEWWQAEREFWHFGEEGEDEDEGEVEGMTFVLKPADDEAGRGGSSSGGEESTDRERDHEKHEVEERSFFDRERTVVPDDKIPSPLKITPPKERDDPLSGTHLVPSAPSPIKDLPSREPPLHVEISRTKANENLRTSAEKAMNEQVVMEIGLDGERILWVSPSWERVVGGPADNVAGTSIVSLLAPADQNVFVQATHHLEVEDPLTIEAKFLMLINPPTRPAPEGLPSPQDNGRPYFIEMDARGMLVKDRIGGEASHTLWLFRPLPTASPISPSASQLQQDQYEPMVTGLGVTGEQEVSVAFHERGKMEPVTPFPFQRPINTSTILCRICELQVPDWFFEKHNETCNEVHKLEADIVECDDSLQELVNTIAQMVVSIDRLGQASPVPGQTGAVPPAQPSVPMRDPLPEYRGVSLFTPGTAPSSPLQSGGLRTSASARLQRVTVRKMQRKLLEDLQEILQAAREIDMPAVNEDAPNVPLERRPFLTPQSEERVALVNKWQKPQTDDPALAQLVQDAETLMRTKVEYVRRMINTLIYSEKVRHEWEEKVEQTLQELESQEGDDADSEPSDSGHEEGETPAAPSTEQPTVVAPSPIPFEAAPASSLAALPAQTSINFVPVPSPASLSPSPPASLSSLSSPYLPVSVLQSASPHPISPLTTSPLVPSPLAFTTPILAHRESDEHHSSEVASSASADAQSSLQMTLGSPAAVPPTVSSIQARRTAVNALAEPTVMVTPPFSPALPATAPSSITLPPANMTASQSSISSKHNRRLSTALPFSPAMSAGPLSPRIPSIAPTSKTTPSSIRDFEIIKPISKGAFGSVYLAKKKTTGDYYAIKVLKKADMIAKNQVTNVKAERTILMQQADSPFVVKLFFTFQNKDYLYLVMEYLNGGDCAALIKTIGALPEDWAKTYVAEVILGLENIHARGIVHRDLKPDNLLIDARGHLKLTDFGLSRIGLFGRQARDGRAFAYRRGSGNHRGRVPRSGFPSRQGSIDSGVASPSPEVAVETPNSFAPSSYFTRGLSPSHLSTSVDDVSESSGSESISGMFQRGLALASESPQQSFASELTSDLRSYNTGGTTPPGEQKFVGTPDYLAPETILATSEDDRSVDWWALGVVTYEFLYGFPPFHADSPSQVFDNIISRRIDWFDEHVDFSKDARDFMERLMCTDPTRRLGFKGAQEVKAHPWLSDIDWEHLTSKTAQFVPQITDPESTDYFDPRGAHLLLFQEEEPLQVAESSNSSPRAERLSLRPGSTHPMDTPDPGLSPAIDDFGAFSFKNLPVLKQANDDVIKKLKAESPLQGPGSLPLMSLHGRRSSISQRFRNKQTLGMGITVDGKGITSPPSPSTSTSSIASTPSRANFPPLTLGGSPGHVRRPSEHGVLDRFKTQHEDGIRRNSMPSRLRTASVSSGGDHTSGTEGTSSWQPAPMEVGTPATSVGSHEMRRGSDPKIDRTIVCLLAEDNVISQKVQEILLTRLGCRCVLVSDGYEAILAACGEIQFDCILMDYQMPILDGELATRFIKGTNNRNKMTPVIAVSAYSALDPSINADLFAGSLSKPVQRDALLAVMKKLGFKVTTETLGSKQTRRVVVK